MELAYDVVSAKEIAIVWGNNAGFSVFRKVYVRSHGKDMLLKDRIRWWLDFQGFDEPEEKHNAKSFMGNEIKGDFSTAVWVLVEGYDGEVRMYEVQSPRLNFSRDYTDITGWGDSTYQTTPTGWSMRLEGIDFP